MNTDKKIKDISYQELIANDEKNGHVLTALMLARIEISLSHVARFITYTQLDL